MNISEVANYFRLDWKTVKEIDKYYIKKHLEEIPLDNLRVIGMDEIARSKGHKYFTVIYDLERNRLLRIIEGRSEKAVSQFFEELGKERCKNIKAVATDMWKAYTNVVNKYCPKALIVYDKFHVVSNYHKLIDKIRRKEFRKADEDGKELLKGTRYLLLKNREKLKEKDQKELEQLLEHNKNLNAVYALKEQLQALWDNVTVASFNNALDQWCELARETGITELEKFADTLERHRSGLWAYCLYQINTSIIEAHNNTIGFVKRQAKGFHDPEYFKLKIFQAINLKHQK
jgi:transposase